MRTRLILALAVTILTIAPVKAQPATSDAPLGLTWGWSADDARKSGVELKDFPGNLFGKSFIATKLNRALADQEATILSFGFDDKLWRIVINSRGFNNDPTGSAAIQRYNELESVLAEKYGKPKATHQLGDSIYSQPKYFLAGIRGGESRWFSNFKTTTTFIQIAITANDGSTGAWRLIYEYLPLQKGFEASKKSQEKNNL